MSRIVTVTPALRPADEGRLDPDAPVSSVVPGYRLPAFVVHGSTRRSSPSAEVMPSDPGYGGSPPP
jgi:hypothetical protein